MTHTYGGFTLEQLEGMVKAREDLVSKQPVLSMFLEYDEFERERAFWRDAVAFSNRTIASRVPALLARVRELEATVREREAEILRLRTTETASAHALDRVRQACGLPERSAPFDVASFVENHLARKDTPCGE